MLPQWNSDLTECTYVRMYTNDSDWFKSELYTHDGNEIVSIGYD